MRVWRESWRDGSGKHITGLFLWLPGRKMGQRAPKIHRGVFHVRGNVQVRELFLKFGGHPMAAGFSIKEQNIDLLRQRLNELSALTEEQLQPKLVIDVHAGGLSVSGADSSAGSFRTVWQRKRETCFCRPESEYLQSEAFGQGRTGRAHAAEKPAGEGDGRRLLRGSRCAEDVIREKYGEAAAEDVISGRCSRQVALNFSYYPRSTLIIRSRGYS